MISMRFVIVFTIPRLVSSRASSGVVLRNAASFPRRVQKQSKRSPPIPNEDQNFPMSWENFEKLAIQKQLISNGLLANWVGIGFLSGFFWDAISPLPDSGRFHS